MGPVKTARRFVINYAGKRFGPVGAKAVDYLLAPTKKAARAARPTAAPVLKGTALKSYLDRTYQRKCGVEVKQYEVVQSAAIGTTMVAVFSPLEGFISQGLTDQNRLGSKIEIKRIQFRFTFSAGAGSTGPARIRLLAVKCGEMAGTNPSQVLLLETPTNIRSCYTNKNDVTRQITVVKDKLINLSALSSGDNHINKDWNWTYSPSGCHEVEWNSGDTTGSLANMTKGNFLFYMMYESLPTTAQIPTFNVYTRVEFIDP